MPDQHATQSPADAAVVAPSSARQSQARMECGVCWYVYDPAQGDDVWQIPPGTAFADLPDHWRCPECDAEQHKFLARDATEQGARHGGLADVDVLVAAYKRVDQERMQDLPFRNTALGVEAVGFQSWQEGAIGVVITPWFMNLVLLPGAETDWSAHKHGDLVPHVLPSGTYEFVHGDLEGFGLLQSCSLQSPVPEFAGMEAARVTAGEVMRLILAAPEETAGEAHEQQGQALRPAMDGPDDASVGPIVEPRGPMSRREFLRGPRAKHTAQE